MSAETFFDLLPPELILSIIRLLPSSDVLALAEADPRIEAILKSTPSVLGQLCVKVAFFRKITDCFYFHPVRRCDVEFTFVSDRQRRVNAVLNLATKIPTGGRLYLHKKLIVILASTLFEAQKIHQGLVERNLFSFVYYGYIPSNVEFELLSQEQVVFIVVRRIDINWKLSTMAAIISLQEPEHLDDFLEAQSLNPRRFYQILETTCAGFESFKRVQAALKPHISLVPVEANALHVSRKEHEERRRDITLDEQNLQL